MKLAPRGPLSILMTTDTVGGVFTYAGELARELARLGDEVHLVTMGGQLPDALRATVGAPGVCLIETDLELEWRDREGRDKARAFRLLRKLESDIRPDVVQLNSFREAQAGFSAPVIVAAHSCVATWQQACDGRPLDESWADYARDVRRSLDAADRWFAPSVAFRDAISARHAPAKRGRVIHNGLRPLPCGDSACRRIVAAGRMWDVAKGVATVRRARLPVGWSLDILGPRRSSDPIDPRETVLAAMRAAPVFVSAALYEPFGLTALEAAFSGCALVLADIPTFRELWGEEALFFPPGDAEALSDALARLCGDPGLLETQRTKAVRRAQDFSVARSARATRALYEAVIAARGRARAAEETAA